MKFFKVGPILGATIALLLLANLGFISLGFYDHEGERMAARRFKVEFFHTNDDSGVEIHEAKTGLPILSEWDFGNGGKPNQESYYFRGKRAFNITIKSNRPPVYTVFFAGPGKSETWWTDRGGSGTFTERIYYGTNGAFLKHEIWYGQAWHTVNDGKKGILINDQWFHLSLDTNGLWAPDFKTGP